MVEGALSMLLALGSYPQKGWKESRGLYKVGAHQIIAMMSWLRAAEGTEGGPGKLKLLLQTGYQSILKLHSFCGEAWEQWHPLPLPKNKGAVGTDSNPPFSPVGAELGGGGEDIVNAPGHLKFLLQDWGKSKSRLRKVKVASRVMNARHDPPPDQKAASLPMAPQMFSTPSSIPLQSATS